MSDEPKEIVCPCCGGFHAVKNLDDLANDIGDTIDHIDPRMLAGLMHGLLLESQKSPSLPPLAWMLLHQLMADYYAVILNRALETFEASDEFRSELQEHITAKAFSVRLAFAAQIAEDLDSDFDEDTNAPGGDA